MQSGRSLWVPISCQVSIASVVISVIGPISFIPMNRDSFEGGAHQGATLLIHPSIALQRVIIHSMAGTARHLAGIYFMLCQAMPDLQ